MTPLARAPTSTSPLHAEEQRRFLQARLANYGRGWLKIAALFLVIEPLSALLAGRPGGPRNIVVFALSLGIAYAVSRLDKARPQSTARLVAIDAGFAWLNTSIFLALGFKIPLFARPELIQLVLVTDLLAVRACVVPSTWRRTAAIGLAPVATMVIGTYLLYADGGPHPDSPPRTGYVQLSLVLGLLMLLITSWISRTIFGLRERVLEAKQLGQYTLLDKIGAGGMGAVYKASHATLRRPTAIKLLPTHRAGANTLARFEREVQLTCTLTHPNTIQIFDYGRSADGTLYYAMEYLDGLDLDSIVTLAGSMPERRVVHVLRQVCGALKEAHDAGLMHRDIKPQNILLCTRGGLRDFVKVVDFGLVKELTGSSAALVSLAGTVIGTPLYMPPEAIVAPSKLDARGDLYALGAVGYFLLTGSPPFRGNTEWEICGMQLHAQPDPPSRRVGHALDAALEALILRCLAKAPDERPQSASALASELDALGFDAWGNEESAAWWAEHQVSVERLRERRGMERDSSPFAPTLEVDLHDRAEPR